MYETLLTFDEDTNVVPLLAKEWSVSEDGKSYTFVLNEGIKFHDGEPFNAESVRAVYDRGLKDSSLRSREPSMPGRMSWLTANTR